MNDINLGEKDARLEETLATLEDLGVEIRGIMEKLGIEPKSSLEKTSDDKEIV